MSIYARPDSPFLWTEFTIEGERFRLSTGETDRRRASLAAGRIKEAKKVEIQTVRARRAAWGGKEPPTLGHLGSRYWTEVGQFHEASETTWNCIEWLINHFGENTLIGDITANQITLMIARRRAVRLRRDKTTKQLVEIPSETVKNATVNRYAIEPLRKLFLRARDVWGYPLLVPDWSKLLLEEPEERVREASYDEEARADEALGPDYGRLFRFTLATGMRARGALLAWRQIDLVNAIARVRSKSRNGQERFYTVPLSTEAMAILTECRGHHEEMVFTFVAKRTVHRKREIVYEAGKRYPITDSGWKTEWRRHVREDGIAPGLRRHDSRHTMGTRFLRQTGNLKATQKLLGHARVETTTKYAHVLIDDLRAGLAAVERAKKAATRKPRTKREKRVGDFVGGSGPKTTT